MGEPDLGELIAVLGIDVDPGLLQQALTHRSWAYENGSTANSERLEWLGDTLLGFAVSRQLLLALPEEPEGVLSTARARLTANDALARAAQRIALGEHLRLGRGEVRSGGRMKASLLANAFEAVIGAVGLSNPVEQAARFVVTLLRDDLDVVIEEVRSGQLNSDPKTALQAYCGKSGRPAPTYSATREGPDHAATFAVTVQILDGPTGQGQGGSRKAAEIAAATDALEKLGIYTLG